MQVLPLQIQLLASRQVDFPQQFMTQYHVKFWLKICHYAYRQRLPPVRANHARYRCIMLMLDVAALLVLFLVELLGRRQSPGGASRVKPVAHPARLHREGVVIVLLVQEEVEILLGMDWQESSVVILFNMLIRYRF